MASRALHAFWRDVPTKVRATHPPAQFFTLREVDGIMGNMRALGISLIVAGLAFVCGALILWPRASQTDDEEKTGSQIAEETETGGMADLLRRLNEIPDDDPLK